MNVEFCIDCGTRLEYTLNKPKFCSSCGIPMGPTALVSPAEISEATDIETLGESGGVPSISKLEYSIDTGQKRMTFGDLMSRASDDPNDTYQRIGSRPKPPALSSDAALKQSIEQCRSAREPLDLGGE